MSIERTIDHNAEPDKSNRPQVVADVAASSADRKAFPGKRCFVVMPFGTKPDLAALVAANALTLGKAPTDLNGRQAVATIDFDAIYTDIILPAARSLALTCLRSDEEHRAGSIHKQMLEQVIGADVVIVDITTQNANVFYELGVRHALRQYTTILVRRADTFIPFNITGMRVVEYRDSDAGQITLSIKRIAAAITDSFVSKIVDSQVHILFPQIRITRDARPIREQHFVERAVRLEQVSAAPARQKADTEKPASRQIGYVTGDIMDVEGIDVWVNPENTKMQMARFHDGSISANIRYFGANRDANGIVLDDTISRELEAKRGGVPFVEPNTVITTGPGRLARLKVSKIVHVAGMHGEPGKGYSPIRDYPRCITNVLDEVDRLNGAFLRRLRLRPLLRSALFPLFGSRSANHDPHDVADALFLAAWTFFRREPNTVIERVYFLAYNEEDRMLCEAAIARMERDGRVMIQATGHKM